MDFFNVAISPRSIELANEVLQSGWISEGKLVKQFEAELACQLGTPPMVAVNSGTSALHLAVALAGIGPDDEVILPAQTFAASGLAVLMQNARVVFADIDPCTGNLWPASVAERITSRTRAIMPVHWGGYPCDLAELNALAEHNGLSVIEDAAHALGATYHGRPIGNQSRFTCYSFQAIKHITTGDGGALCCRDEADREAALRRRWFGIDRANSRPSILGERVFDLEEVGYKYHLNDLAAAIGLGNLADFPRRLARRRQIGQFYREALSDLPGLTLLCNEPDREHAYWLFTVLVDRREDLIRKLKEVNIPTSVVHLSIDRYAVFGGLRDDLPGQAVFNARQLAIPVHDALTDEDLAHIVGTIRTGW
jgi:perosamine synthetase